MAQPSNKQLSDKIDSVDRKAESRYNSLKKSFNSLKKEMNDKIQPLYEDFIGRRAVERSKANTNTQVMGSLIKILLILSAVVATLLSVDIKGLLGA